MKASLQCLLHRSLAIALLGIGLAGLRAASPVPPPEVDVEFSLYAWQANLPGLRYSPEDSVKRLEADTRSSVYHYSGPATLCFYDLKAKLSSNPVKRPYPLATVNFPAGATRFTLLTFPKRDGTHRMLALPENGDLLPRHCIELHNLTDHLLFVHYDKESGVQIPASGSALIRPGGNATVIDVSRSENGRWIRLFNNVIELPPETRGHAMLAQDAERPVFLLTLPPWPAHAGSSANATSTVETPESAEVPTTAEE